MTPEQQTPASVVERLRLRATEYNDREGRYSYIGDDVALDDKAAALIERLLAEREGLRKAGNTLLALIDETDAYQRRPNSGEWGVECACCMGELFDGTDRVRIDTARAALSTQGESRQTGWQDIATAPKDGGDILLTYGDDCVIARPNGDGTFDDGEFRDRLEGFTHWRPLPAAPGEG